MMPSATPTKPSELAAELHISPKTLRAFLRDTFEHEPRTRWHLSNEQVALARRRFLGNMPAAGDAAPSKLGRRRGRLSVKQRRLLAFVYRAFSEAGDWPRAIWLQRALDRQGQRLDLEELLPTLRGDVTGDVRADSPVRITLSGLARLREARADINAYLSLVRRAYELYLTSDSPVLTSDAAAAELGLTPLARKRMLHLIDAEPPFAGGSSSHDGTEWQREVSQRVRHFRNVTSLPKYLKVKERLVRSPMPALEDPGHQTKWAGVESRLRELQVRFGQAATSDDLQDVGRRTREVTSDAAWVVSAAGVQQTSVSSRDALRQLDAFLATHAKGATWAELRGLLRALLSLANAETHRADPSRTSAFANVQSATALIRILQSFEAEIAQL